ncbi:MAG TPA: glycogen synthase [Candidatus Omnitrophica bacterium]|nr:glycogen synthase [Candidatus Omnitrophota bacterium]
MRIAFMTSEAVPFAKTGGLADVCGALPLELENLGHEVAVFMPRYQSIGSLRRIIHDLDCDLDWAQFGEKSKAYFIKHDMYLRDGLYGDHLGDFSDNLRRFSYFSLKSLEVFKRIDFVPDIIHVHDWQTSLVPVYLSAFGHEYFRGDKIPKTALTVHNISYQGIFPKEELPQTHLSWDYFTVAGLEFYGKIDLLKGGIQYADIINTVSPTHALEIQTKEYGCGLDGVLRSRRGFFSGIINGIDYKVWNPQGDPLIFKNYSCDFLEGKKQNKLMLQEACGLTKNDTIPLCGFVGRLVEQKGIDLILEILPELIAGGFQVVVLGVGEPQYMESLSEIAKKNPGSVFYSRLFDDPLAHKIYAGSDLFFMPSRFEPCGIAQMISFKYGTIPVVYKTGGLSDTVEDYHQKKDTGSGFVFDRYEAREFFLAIQRARAVLFDEPRRKDFLRRIMKLNFSWKESAKQYVEMYKKVLSP